MMTLQKAIATLDDMIPAPSNPMVDNEHLHIANAWQECKKALASYDDMQDRHDTLMRRWEAMIETIRSKIDAGTLTAEDRQLLKDLNLPFRFDKRTGAVQDDGQKLEVETAMGTLIAYPSLDPDNPGIFIDLKKAGVNYTLNLSGTECQQGEEKMTPLLKTHVWGDAENDDTTFTTEHLNVDAYFIASDTRDKE